MSEYRLIPLGGKLGEGKFAKVSPEDYEKLHRYPWRYHYMGYARTHIYVSARERTTVYMHRMVIDAPKGVMVDHRDGDKLNNTRENLRLATHAQNMRNQHKVGGASRFKGVSWDKRYQKWRAAISLDGKCKYLGRYDSEVTAAKAYDVAAVKFYGDFAKPNF